MNIVVSFKKKWGKQLFYPVSEDAKFICSITGRPTLLKRQLKRFSERGWTVSIIQDPINIEECLNVP